MLAVLTFSCLPFTSIYFIYTEVFLRPRKLGLVIFITEYIIPQYDIYFKLKIGYTNIDITENG